MKVRTQIVFALGAAVATARYMFALIVFDKQLLSQHIMCQAQLEVTGSQVLQNHLHALNFVALVRKHQMCSKISQTSAS